MANPSGCYGRRCRSKTLEDALRRRIRVTRTLEVRVTQYDGQRLVLRAPLASNRNHYGCAFAGSIGALLMLSGFGLIHLKLGEMGQRGQILLAKCAIFYRRTVSADIEAFSELAAGSSVERLRHALRRRGAAKVKITGGVLGGSDPAVVFEATYAVRRLASSAPGCLG